MFYGELKIFLMKVEKSATLTVTLTMHNRQKDEVAEHYKVE
jgi:hypothetical protein